MGYKLTARQKRFCQNLLTLGGRKADANSAAIAAGFVDDTALSSKMLATPAVQDYLKNHRVEYVDMAGSDPTLVIDALARISGLDINSADGVMPSDLDDETAMTVSCMTFDRETGKYTYEHEDPVPAADLLNRVAGAYDSFQRAKAANIKLVVNIDPQDLLV